MESDIFCLRSFSDPYGDGHLATNMIPNDESLRFIERLAIPQPPLDPKSPKFPVFCYDCGENIQSELAAYMGVHFNSVLSCTIQMCCFGKLPANLLHLREVFIVVPNLPRASPTDSRMVLFVGDDKVIDSATYGDSGQEDYASVQRVISSRRSRYLEENSDFHLQCVETIERPLWSPPVTAQGNGVELYEVPAVALPHVTVWFVRNMAMAYAGQKLRKMSRLVLNMPPSEQRFFALLNLCPHVVEFRVLSYSV